MNIAIGKSVCGNRSDRRSYQSKNITLIMYLPPPIIASKWLGRRCLSLSLSSTLMHYGRLCTISAILYRLKCTGTRVRAVKGSPMAWSWEYKDCTCGSLTVVWYSLGRWLKGADKFPHMYVKGKIYRRSTAPRRPVEITNLGLVMIRSGAVLRVDMHPE